MRKRFLFAAVVLSVMLCYGEVFANIDNLSNLSVEWIRTGNRNAATDAADIVVYNPGGITELPDGFQVNIGNQSLIREPEHEFDLGSGSQSYTQDSADLFLPNVYVTYNKDDWAIYGAFNIVGGGATVDYPDGSITTTLLATKIMLGSGGAFTGSKNDYLEAESTYYTFTVGGAYEFCDYFSAALGLRYLYADNSLKAGVTFISPMGDVKTALDADRTADGIGVVFGFNINPTDRLNIAFHYDSQIDLEFENEINTDSIPGGAAGIDGSLADKAKFDRDFPAMAGFGVGYDFTDKLYGEINYSYWFQENCDWGSSNGKEISDMAGDAYSIGITFSYKFTEKLLGSIGTTYTDFLWNDVDGYYEANIGSYEVLYSDNWHIGIGGYYELMDGVKLNLALGRTIWKDRDLNHSSLPTPVKTKNATTIIAIGVNVAF